MRETTKKKLILVLIALDFLPFVILSSLPEANVDSLVSYFASITGYAAAILFLWQIALGSRIVTKHILRLKDQVWARNIHKNIGIYAIVLVLLHPVLILAKYNQDISWVFFGSLDSKFDQHVAMGRGALYIFLITWLLSALLRSKIAYRPWKYIHYLTYPMVLIVMLHPIDIGTFYFGSGLIRWYWGLLLVVFGLMMLARVAQLFTFGQRQYTLATKKKVSDQTYLYAFEPQTKPISSRPGQYLYLRTGFISEEHPFSVVSNDPKTGKISIATKVFGPYTQKLTTLSVGDSVYLDGAYGTFTCEIDNRPTVFIAGGIGITPFVQHILGSKRSDMFLFYCNRTRQNVTFGGALKKKLGSRLVHILSEEKVRGTQHGYISADTIEKKLGKDFKNSRYFICGPPAMMNSSVEILRSSGVPDSQIHTEEFSF
ncbi:MAG: ferric reductase-like transmembrane domain-containing protein [Patescibacteria group bacterium]